MLQTGKGQITLITIGTVLAAFSLISIVQFTDPYSASKYVLILFYISLFLLSLGAFTLLGLFIRQKLFKGLYIIHLTHSFRQAFFVALLLVASLLLLTYGLLFWWVELTLILFLVSFEIFLNLRT